MSSRVTTSVCMYFKNCLEKIKELKHTDTNGSTVINFRVTSHRNHAHNPEEEEEEVEDEDADVEDAEEEEEGGRRRRRIREKQQKQSCIRPWLGLV